MDNPIRTFIHNALAGVEEGQISIDTLYGIYITKFYSSYVEYLLILHSKKPAFQEALVNVITDARNLLPEEDKKTVDELMEKKKQTIVGEILAVFASNLSDDLKAKIQENIKRLADAPKQG